MIEWLSQAAQIANAFAVVILAAITWYYARTTDKILIESKKMREAAEKQASSAQSQASAASATLNHLRQQVEDLQDLGISIVRLTIDKLVRSIDDWKKIDIIRSYGSAGAFPSPEDLAIRDEQNVLGHARRISDTCSQLLNDAFSDLRSARVQIEILIKSRSLDIIGQAHFEPGKYDPSSYLTDAFTKLQNARDELESAAAARRV